MLDYNPLTGVMRWKAGRLAGKLIKAKDRCGYIRFQLDNRSYGVSRVAYLMVTGHFPDGFIDHINRVPDDNRWCNFRVVSVRQNAINRVYRRKENGDLPRGVSQAPTGRFRARIRKQMQEINLGYFDTPEAAHAAYLAAHGSDLRYMPKEQRNGP